MPNPKRTENRSIPSSEVWPSLVCATCGSHWSCREGKAPWYNEEFKVVDAGKAYPGGLIIGCPGCWDPDVRDWKSEWKDRVGEAAREHPSSFVYYRNLTQLDRFSKRDSNGLEERGMTRAEEKALSEICADLADDLAGYIEENFMEGNFIPQDMIDRTREILLNCIDEAFGQLPIR